MNAFVPYLAALHQQDLLEAACLDRLAKRSGRANPQVSALRRLLGSGARRLSGLFASAARSLDPSVEAERPTRRSTETVGHALAG